MRIIEDVKPFDIKSFKMNDGQIAIITQWGKHTQYVGVLVQRYGTSLIALGEPRGGGWPEWFEADASKDETYRVRILPKGTKIEI